MSIRQRIASIFKPAAPTVERLQSLMRKTADWNDITAKAKRMIGSGKVHVVANTPTHTMAKVQGDHGNYDCEIKREDPNAPYALTQSTCTCPWEQYRWDRTRKFKRLEGRMCSHLLAAYWQGLRTPMDVSEEDYTHAPGQRRQPMDITPDTQQAEMPMEMQEDVSQLPRTFQPGDPTPPGPEATPDEIGIAQQPDNPFEVKDTRPTGPQRQPMDITRRVVFDEYGNPLPADQQPGAFSQPTMDHPPDNPGLPGALSSWQKRGMAERTGDAELDQAIEDFKRENPALGEHWGIDRSLSDMKWDDGDEEGLEDGDWHRSTGMCAIVAMNFTTWLRDRGIDAWVSDEMADEGGHEADWHGYRDRRDSGNPLDFTHCATGVYKDGKTYLIDWTASQYGYTEFPMVQRADEEADWNSVPEWQREWTASKFASIPVRIVESDNWLGLGDGEDEFTQWFQSQPRDKDAVAQLINDVTLELRGGKIPVPGKQPKKITDEGIEMYHYLDLGWDPEQMRRVNADEGISGAPEWRGQYATAPAGKRAIVRKIEPITRMVEIMVPLNETGKLQPHLMEGWISYDDLAPLDGYEGLATPFKRRSD